MSAAKRRIKRKIKMLAVLLALAGCQDASVPIGSVPDQCLRREIFKECMAALPAGPVATKYNDWDDVVKECESAAYYQSRRSADTIKPECRP